MSLNKRETTEKLIQEIKHTRKAKTNHLQEQDEKIKGADKMKRKANPKDKKQEQVKTRERKREHSRENRCEREKEQSQTFDLDLLLKPLMFL